MWIFFVSLMWWWCRSQCDVIAIVFFVLRCCCINHPYLECISHSYSVVVGPKKKNETKMRIFHLISWPFFGHGVHVDARRLSWTAAQRLIAKNDLNAGKMTGLSCDVYGRGAERHHRQQSTHGTAGRDETLLRQPFNVHSLQWDLFLFSNRSRRAAPSATNITSCKLHVHLAGAQPHAGRNGFPHFH